MKYFKIMPTNRTKWTDFFEEIKLSEEKIKKINKEAVL